MARVILCPGCGEEKEHHAKGLCLVCYKREWRYTNPLKRYEQRVRYRRRRASRRRGYPPPLREGSSPIISD